MARGHGLRFDCRAAKGLGTHLIKLLTKLLTGHLTGRHSRESEARESLEGGFGEKVALHEEDSAVAQCGVFFDRFYSLGDDVAPHLLAELHHGLDDQLGGGALMQVPGEFHIEFDDFCREVGEQVETAVAGTEVVQGNVESVATVFGDNRRQMCAITDFLGLGDLKQKAVAGKAEALGGRQREPDAGGGAVDCAGHEVDGEPGAGLDKAQLGGEGNRVHSTVLIEGVTVCLGHLAKNRRGGLARWAPHQGFVGEYLSGPHIANRLEGHGEGEGRLDSVLASAA